MRISRPVTSACTLSLLLLMTFAAAAAFAQGAKMQSPYDPIADSDADHPVQRDLWFSHGRLIPGQSAASLRYRAHLQKMQMRAARLAAAQRSQQSATPSGSSWTALGPAPLASDASGAGLQDYSWVSGRATAVVIDPADTTGGTVYVGGAYGGVWRSQNATAGGFGNASGVTWIPLTDNQATLAIGAIALQPGNTTGTLSNVVLVGTGEANSAGDSYYGLGILRSADAGNTWSLISTANGGSLSFDGLAAARMAFSTSQTSTVAVAMATSVKGSEDGLITSSTQRGLYTSTDAGLTWTFDSVKDSGVTLNPATSATSVVYNATAGAFFAAIRYHGFYTSTDGINWSRLALQPGNGTLSTAACPVAYVTTCPIYRGEIAVVPARNEMYVWYVDVNENDQGIWRSTNGGTSWTQIPDTSITNCGDAAGGCGTQQGTYNLEIAAIPSGSATDLYVGAINLYKCTLANTASTTCTQSLGNWLNLTHVYGCSTIAKVHPDQHALDFKAPVNGKDIMYFANDGGIYRALDGYLGLATGTCGGTNQFDSLNQTLGSMTQFVSFSEHPSDPKTLLGGTQDNGSPATASATVSTQWLNVNAGDGGYNAINPASTSEWFTANTDVSVQRCTLGASCHSGDFNIVALPGNLGNDHGAFYTPYTLDPQVLSSELLIGTCRVWRGTGTGAGFTALSGDFEPSAFPPCTGGEVNLVRSLAAGGPKDTNGLSNVIYAGTDGFGSTTIPLGGHIWVTTNAAGGTSTWADRTGTINPGAYPISGVALDTADATGQTAYVTIMGWNVSHVWKTTNAGVSWTDFSGTGLPNAPANAVVVDPGTAVYVATDVGIFSSSTGSAAWTEVGPAPSSGQAGYLPNVSVTALRIFNSGGMKHLRASTYGRGIWDFDLVATPDYQFSFPASSQAIFPTQNAVFSGTATASNGYNSSVALSCTGTVPSTCNLSPTSVTPTSAGATFTVTTAGAVGDYAFNAHGVGTDTSHVTHDFPLTLHVVDFAIGVPSPGSVTVNRPHTSQNITFQVSASGSFSGSVALSCSGLPTGANCNFSPSATVNPTSSSPVTVTLTISTSVTTPPGTSTVTISASTSGAPAAKTQSLSLTVTAIPDYILSTGISYRTTVNQALQITGTLTAVNGYSSAVSLSCTGAAPSTCTPSPASVTPTAAGVPFTVTVNSATAGTFNFTITGTGTDSAHITHGVAVQFVVNADFTVSSNVSSQTVMAGQTAMYTLTFTPVGASTFGSTVTYTASGLPAQTTANFNPTSIPGTSGTTAVTLSVITMGPNSSQRRVIGRANRILLPIGLSVMGIVLTGLGGGTRRRRQKLAAGVCLVIALTVLLPACGGGGNTTSPPPVVKVTISPTSANLFTNGTQQFNASVTGNANTQVNWQVNGAAGGSSTTGTITTAGLYTAPATVPSSAVNVTAVSQADSTKSASASVTVNASTAGGTYTITVNAMLGGAQHSVPVTLVVQ